MQTYTVFLDEMRDNSRANAALLYQIAIAPLNRRGGAMATKQYSEREAFISALKQYLQYNDAAVERFLMCSDGHQTMLHSLSDEDAACLGWIPEYNKH